ncbi:MAG: RNA pseudouridine synthase, partial [Candidatus Omnitrophica bacterium]|nr:RNA pseudouridine synthase [Candidatus Omnitrophota bacterium]
YLLEANHRRLGKGGYGRNMPVRKKRVFIVHRIDKDASGLLVFAKSEDVKHSLQSGWKNVKKKYFAVVAGIPKEKSGSVTSFLRENKALNVYTADRADDAKLSTTRFRVLRSSAHYSLLEIELETGRKHQIRVHLADLGHPIAGDERYGCKTNPAGRLALHACELALIHPVSGKRMVFHSAMPDSFDQILKKDKAV